MNRSVAVQMHKVPLNRNYSFFGLNVSSSGHPFTVKNRPSSVTFDVIVELPVVGYLDFDGVLVDGLFAFLAFTPGGLRGLSQNFMKTHKFY